MRISTLIAIGLFGLMAVSCGGRQGNGVKFNPNARDSSMTDEGRKAAIAEKKKSLNPDISSMMNSNGVKLTMLPPSPSGDITEEISERIGAKMLGLIAANGIGGVNNVPDFALAATISETGRETSGGIPQKYIIKYEINYKVINMLDGTVYGAVTETIIGAGNSFQEATRNAVNEIKPTDNLRQMLSTASERIVGWYDTNLSTFKNQVAAAVEKRDFALALAYLNSVPSQATEAYTYASQEYAKVLEAYKTSESKRNLSALKAAIASSSSSLELDPQVYACLAMIPEGSQDYKDALAAVTNYEKGVAERQAREDARQAKAEEARNKAEELKKEREHVMQMAQMQADKEIAVAEAKASEQAIKQHMKEQADSKRGFWGNLGARIICGMDYMGSQITGGNEL